MSSEEDRMKSNSNASSNNEDIDMDALMAGIKRVSSNDKTSAKSKPSSSASPASNRPRTGNTGVASQKRKKAMARRKKVERLMILTIVLVILAIGVGVFYAISKLVNDREKTNDAETTVISQVDESMAGTESESSSATTNSVAETTPTPTPTPAPTPFPVSGPNLSGYCVVIDPGHQEVANTDQEAMSTEMGGSKDRSAEGYSGVVTGINESEINLEVALLLKAYLQSLDCEVYLTRETNDVDISNQERAAFAVEKNPDVYIRLYCNAANDSLTSGCEVIVPASGKYASELSVWGDNLGKTIDNFTKGGFNGCKSSSNYSGLNWADSIPAFMVRMGYLTNSDEEANLLDEAYRLKICQGIAQFISTMPKD